jgi:hypothetical protein
VDREIVVLLPGATALAVTEVDRTVAVFTTSTVVIKSTTTTLCVKVCFKKNHTTAERWHHFDESYVPE